jgi:hypothetical protein
MRCLLHDEGDSMLKALPRTRQNEGEAKRVWYFSSSLDMFVWFDSEDVPFAFDLTYQTRRCQERTVSWHRERGYRHWKPEAGRIRFGSGAILVHDGAFDRIRVAAQFLAQCVDVPAAITSQVLQRLAAFELSAPRPATGATNQIGDAGAPLETAPA